MAYLLLAFAFLVGMSSEKAFEAGRVTQGVAFAAAMAVALIVAAWVSIYERDER